MNFTALAGPIRAIGASAVKHGPAILTVVGNLCTIGAVGTAIAQTPRVMQIIDDQQPEGAMAIAKCTYKCYIPTALLTVVSIGCTAAAHRINAARIATAASALALTTNSFQEYKDKVRDFLGEQKEEKVRAEIAKDHIQQNPPAMPPTMKTDGTFLYNCYEPITKRYFQTDVDGLRRLNLKAMEEFVVDPEANISLGDFFFLAGLENTAIGESFHFEFERGDFIHWVTCTGPNGEPAFEIHYNYPIYDVMHNRLYL